MNTFCSCSAHCHSCNKVGNECGAVLERQNPDSEISSLFSRTGFGVDASKTPFSSIDNPNPNPNPNQGGFEDKSSVAFRGCVPSNFHATSSWTQSSVFGPSKTTTHFDRSATPLNPFSFSVPPISEDTSTGFGWRPTTQPHENGNGNGKTQGCNECGAVKARQNLFAPSRPVDVSKSPFCNSSSTGTGTGGFDPNKFSSEGFVPSNFLASATTSWTRPFECGPSKTTPPFGFDFSATPLHSFKFPPAPKDTTASGKPTPTVYEFSKSTIIAEPQPQLTLPIFVLTMMGSSVGFTQIGTMPATPCTNGNGITISGSPTFGSPATIASFGTGPPQPSWGSHLFGTGPPQPSFGTPLFGAPAATAQSFPQNAAFGHN